MNKSTSSQGNTHRLAPVRSHWPVLTVDYEDIDKKAGYGDAIFMDIGQSTWNKDDYTKPWWYDYKVTCNGTPIQTQTDSDTFKVHPDSTVYQVGGSDYKTENTYVNVSGTQSNKVDPNVSAWSCTYKTDVPKTYTNSVKR